MAHTIEDHQQAADQWRHAGSVVQEATSATDLLGIPIPQSLAFALADLYVFDKEIMRIARARGLDPEPEPEVPATRHDEAPEDGQDR